VTTFDLPHRRLKQITIDRVGQSKSSTESKCYEVFAQSRAVSSALAVAHVLEGGVILSASGTKIRMRSISSISCANLSHCSATFMNLCLLAR